MKSKVCEVYPKCEVVVTDVKKLYVVDFTERTMSARKVEIHIVAPLLPNTSQKMDCLTVNNEGAISVAHAIFDDNQFKDEKGSDIKHCECCLFPATDNEENWILFVEIKDCKPKNIANYRDWSISQLISTVREFKKHHLIEDKNKVHAIISFPRRNKTAFNDMIVGDNVERTRLFKQHKILFAATNTVAIIDHQMISPIL